MSASEIADELIQGTTQVHSRNELVKKLESDRPLRIKLGFDPSSPDLHIGHVVVLDKIRQFQDLGHTAVIIIGDYTARIGDPTGRSKTRPALEPEQVNANAQTYTEQVFKILDPDKTEVRRNGEWFDHFTYADVLKLNAHMSVAQLLERDDFQKRYRNGESITLTEFQYPLMQGYDSVMAKSDVELGGNDQLFNNLVGRDLQRANGQDPQVVIVLPILTGTDGSAKMSKSLNNAIGILEKPDDIYGKVMSINDETMIEWRDMIGTAYNLPQETPDHPMEAKKQLATAVVTRFHGPDAGSLARENWDKIHSTAKKDITAADLDTKPVSKSPIWIVDLLRETGAATSGGKARQLISQGAVKLDGEKISDDKAQIEISGNPILVCGKKFQVRLELTA